MKKVVLPFGAAALLSLTILGTSCKKDHKSCGCDAESIESFSDRPARLSYDSIYHEYILITAPDSINYIQFNSLCNGDILADSIKKNYTNTTNLLYITGERKTVCPSNYKTMAALYSQGLVQVKELHVAPKGN
jgi:hypothetical protein